MLHARLCRILLLTLAWAAGGPGTLAAQGTADAAIPTFARDVAPILFRACASCHRPSGPAPFSVLTYQDVTPWTAGILQSTASGRMPPWLPDDGPGVFAGERRLTDHERATIRRWVESGAPPGDAAHLPPAPSFPDGWVLGPPDLVVTLPTYTIPADTGDRYRNLVARVPLSGARWVKAVEVRPGGVGVVHHATMMLDTTASSRELDAEDPEPGFDGMHLRSGATHPGGFFVGWTPGRVPTPGTDSMAWLLRPGTDLVLQVHVRPHGRAQPITPQIGLSFAAGAPVRHPAVLMLGSRDIDIPAGAPEYVVQDTFELPVDVQVLAVYPHAHYLGRALEGFARLPNGRTRWLVRIRDWDFNWQDEYRYAEPVFLPGGSTVTMRWRYDNSAANPRNPSRPPRRVEYGPRSSDEMADLVLQVLPQAEADRETLERDLRWKYLADAADWAARSAYRRGAELREAGRHAEAAEQFRQALSHRPAPGYHAALAEALASLGQRNAAALHLQEALRLAESQGNQALAAEMRRRLGRLR